MKRECILLQNKATVKIELKKKLSVVREEGFLLRSSFTSDIYLHSLLIFMKLPDATLRHSNSCISSTTKRYAFKASRSHAYQPDPLPLTDPLP